MEKVINLNIPHVGEKILDHIDTNGLIQCFSVSKDWKVLAESVLVKRWRDKCFEACTDPDGNAKIVELLLDRLDDVDLFIWFTGILMDGATAFMWACYDGRTEVFKVLLHMIALLLSSLAVGIAVTLLGAFIGTFLLISLTNFAQITMTKVYCLRTFDLCM